MPTYDYRCAANGRIVEVKHRMAETVETWGALCSLAGIDTEDTPAESPVQRLATGGNVIKRGSLGQAAEPPCATGGCCGGGACGFDS